MKKLALLIVAISFIAASCNNQEASEIQKDLPNAPKKSTSNCDPNYSGCVPISSDVDCAGGSGNGPAYVQGPINVIGHDVYKLDRDGDGVACE